MMFLLKLLFYNNEIKALAISDFDEMVLDVCCKIMTL